MNKLGKKGHFFHLKSTFSWIQLQLQLLKKEQILFQKYVRENPPTYVCLMDETRVLLQQIPWQVPHHQLFTSWFFSVWSATSTMFILILMSVFNVLLSNLRSLFISEKTHFTSAIFPTKMFIFLFIRRCKNIFKMLL